MNTCLGFLGPADTRRPFFDRKMGHSEAGLSRFQRGSQRLLLIGKWDILSWEAPAGSREAPGPHFERKMGHSELGGASRVQRGSRRALLKGKWATCSFLGVWRPPAPFLGPPAAFEPFGSHHGAQEPTFFLFARAPGSEQLTD